MNKPSIIFIILDTLRSDRVFRKINNFDLTPFMEKIAKNSLFFSNCIANSPWTLPSHSSMFTGLYPSQNVYISGKVDILSDKVPILAEILKKVGYHTIAYTENPWISNSFGLIRGFEKYCNNSYSEAKISENSIDTENRGLRDYINYLNEKLEFFYEIINVNIIRAIIKRIIFQLNKLVRRIYWKEIIREVLLNKRDTLRSLHKLFNFIAKEKTKPIYLFLNLMTVHDPYTPLFKNVFQKLAIDNSSLKQFKDFFTNSRKKKLEINLKGKKPSKNLQNLISKFYDGAVKSIDIILKKLFEQLKKLNLDEDSFIIITSDHGEHLGSERDHYLWEHNTHQSVYDQLLRVPLFIYHHNFKGKHIENQVQLKDLFHTILDIANVSKTAFPSFKPENSILYQIKNNSTPQFIYGEYLKKKKNMLTLIKTFRRHVKKEIYPKIINDIQFIRYKNEKYIKYNSTRIEEYYDLKQDPNEQKNLFKSSKSKLLIKSKFYQFLKKIQDKDFLEQIVTKKEKDNLKEKISNIKFKKI